MVNIGVDVFVDSAQSAAEWEWSRGFIRSE
jgi:hypothetical protein